MGLSKNLSITERFKLQLRGEFFNIFNHVNFDEASATGNFAKLSTGTKGNFGALTTALDPRSGQIAWKIIFKTSILRFATLRGTLSLRRAPR